MEAILETNELTRKIVDILEEHKAEDIVLMDVSNQVDFTDYFIICNGTSDRMLQSLGDAVTKTLQRDCQIRGSMQGEASGGWILLDLMDIVVHIFSPDRRAYYDLEELFSQSKILLRME